MGVQTKYGSIVVWTSAASQILDAADGEAFSFGHINNTTAAAQFIDFLVTVQVPIGTAIATGDTYSIYVLDSLDDVHWTDDIVYGAEADQADKIAASKLATVVAPFHTSAQPVTSIASFNVASVYPTMPPYISFLFKNDTNGAIPPGASASYIPITVSAT